MKFTTVSVSYSRKFNLGDYESSLPLCLFGEDADGITQFLYLQAKASVKQAVMPVLKASEFQINKAKSSKKVSGDINESYW
jgi:hypothetical protein